MKFADVRGSGDRRSEARDAGSASGASSGVGVLLRPRHRTVAQENAPASAEARVDEFAVRPWGAGPGFR
jgi:hypothetical protein